MLRRNAESLIHNGNIFKEIVGQALVMCEMRRAESITQPTCCHLGQLNPTRSLLLRIVRLKTKQVEN